MKKPVSVSKAIAVGLLAANAPVLPLLFSPMFLLLPFMTNIEHTFGLGVAIFIFFGSLIGGTVIAWVWWSFTVPKWRLWAYERVIDIPALKRKAVEVGLVWPDGHIFEKTEFKSAAHAAKEKAIEQKRAL